MRRSDHHTRALALLSSLGAVGCGGATPATTTFPPQGVAARDFQASGEPSPAAPAGVAAMPEEIEWMRSDLVRCVRGAAEPEGAVIAGAGTSVRVRARSVAFDEEEGGGRIVCEATRTVSGQLVLVIEPYDGRSIGVLEADRIRVEAYDLSFVRLPGETSVTTARLVRYCPDGSMDPSTFCVVAGSREAVLAYVDRDPNAPRSGWDQTTRMLTTSRLRRARTSWLDERACGLEVGFRGAPRDLDCTRDTLAERLACIGEEGASRAMDLEDAESDEYREALRREAAVFQLVLTDGRRELAIPAFDVASFACVDGHVLLRPPTAEFTSARAYGAVEVRNGAISGGHWMAIRDHEESLSECANAWDGIQLVPVLREGRVVGGIVLGAGRRPLFEVVRGDVGDVGTPAFWPGENGEPPRPLQEGGFAYGDEPVPVALRETPDGLLAIPAPAPSPPCRLVVDDADGQTNLRPDASSRRDPIGTLPNGTVIVPVEQRGRWYRIATPTPGWVFAANLDRRCAAP
ncbi:MAG: hypothetical protein OHK0013_38990 [Sandaracinaceae bacterium]